MNLQLHDILSNPALLKEVSDDTLQKWIQQYPYVSLFHLYALKKKKKYTETDLHKTAFYFNNREKLFFLLNDTQLDTRITSYERTIVNPPPIQIEQEIQEEKSEETITEQENEHSEEVIVPAVEEIEKENITEPVEETIIEEITEKHIDEVPEVTNHSEEEILIDDISTAALETTDTKDIVLDEEIKTELVEEAETIIPPLIPAPDKPLSIAEQIMLEIQQLKEDRAKKAAEENKIVEIKEENKNILAAPAIEMIEEKVEDVQDTVLTEDVKEAEIIEDLAINKQETEENRIDVIETAVTEIIKDKEQEVVSADILVPDETVIEDKKEEITEDAKEEIEEISIPETTEKTLSIQDEVIARIQKIKEERERKIHEQTETPLPEIIENKEEEVVSADILIPVETVVVDSKKEITVDTKEEVEEISAPEIEKENIIAEKTEKTLSIQDEVIARIQKIKEERERRLHEQTETPVPEIIEEKEQEVVAADILVPAETVIEDSKEEITEETKEEVTELSSVEPEKENIITEPIEKPLSIQDEVIARIQKIKEERERRLHEQTEIPVPEAIENKELEVVAADILVPAETVIEDKKEEITEVVKEKVVQPETETTTATEEDIKIVEKTERLITPVLIDEKHPIEEMLAVSSTDKHEKDIELIESKLQPEIEKEFNDADVLSEIHEPVKHTKQEIPEVHTETSLTDILPSTESIEEPETVLIETEEKQEETEETSNQFEKIFPDPLLVHVDVTEIKKENTYQEKPVVEEKKEEIVEHASLISNKSDLFIPNVEEDVIEEAVKDEPKVMSETEEPIVAKLDEEAIKEPHTFIEWLKLLDGNLQIQTTESPKETDNWIEIPRYEVEQALANKKEIQKEEQKLFEPNFEEGEVDLFNEIDEEVSKVASESVSFKQDMMTETLAKIYHKQGKTDKALEIYNTLLMKFPEKSAYFATLIEKIEKEG